MDFGRPLQIHFNIHGLWFMDFRDFKFIRSIIDPDPLTASNLIRNNKAQVC